MVVHVVSTTVPGSVYRPNLILTEVNVLEGR
jgi:hypothetical protein